MGILVYADVGVFAGSFRELWRSLQLEAPLHQRRMALIDARALAEEAWNADLLVFPGGRDRWYQGALQGMALKKIRAFVEEGGSYMGFCGGAYFGASFIEFEMGQELEICEERDLKFFPGKAVGPALGCGKFSYQDDRGAAAARISWGDGEAFAYYNGGPCFEQAQHYPSVEVLSNYLDLGEPSAAIVSCKVGRGTAILSGVHVEYRYSPLLAASEVHGQAIFRALLQRALLCCPRCR